MEVRMQAKLSAVLGGVVAIALVIVALWGLGQAPHLAENADRPDLALWAVRSAALAAFAAAQVLGMTFVVELFYNRDSLGELCRMAAGVVCTVALVSAITLGIFSR
jgi:hypothetical protein